MQLLIIIDAQSEEVQGIGTSSACWSNIDARAARRSVSDTVSDDFTSKLVSG